MKKTKNIEAKLNILKYEGFLFLAIQETEDKESYYCLKLKKDLTFDSKYLNSSHVLPKHAVEIIGFLSLIGDFYISV